MQAQRKYLVQYIIIGTWFEVEGLGGRLGPCSRVASTSGGGGGGGQLGIGGDQSSEVELTNVGGVEEGLSFGGGGLAGLEFFGRMIVGFTDVNMVWAIALCLDLGSSLLNSYGIYGWLDFVVFENGSSINEADDKLAVVLFDNINKSKSSSKPLSTWKYLVILYT